MSGKFRWSAAVIAGLTVAGAIACTSRAASTAAPTSASTAGTSAAKAARPCGVTTTASAYRHVIWIWFENHSYSGIKGSSSAPYFNSIASECGVATNYHNLTHPSLPNYVGATSGIASFGLFYTDCNPSKLCTSSRPSIFGQGEAWKAYEESMPSNCAPSNAGEYAVRHNPPAYFTALTTCSANDVPYTQLATNLANTASPKDTSIGVSIHDPVESLVLSRLKAFTKPKSFAINALMVRIGE